VNFNEEAVGAVTVVEAIGRLDSANAPKLQERIGALIAGGKPSVLLDLSKVEYISSAGFRSLLLLARQATQTKCRFVLCGLTPKVRQLFELGGFLDILPIAQNREEGIAGAQ
jgi:stage II sporulation protein AA (anti-sigma F factor antagonist)